jgi:hypothetical protein
LAKYRPGCLKRGNMLVCQGLCPNVPNSEFSGIVFAILKFGSIDFSEPAPKIFWGIASGSTEAVIVVIFDLSCN